ncbi:hypothetical protein [Streptomyces sp. YIM 121038]|uniref:hypothetical protein n=1 Tax=Streptomyces sp. YIM 121038 TaxID=2136401 RepID=UPI00111041F0|nr:hypothetical protein [Streptomyces sp. YIM 121038]
MPGPHHRRHGAVLGRIPAVVVLGRSGVGALVPGAAGELTRLSRQGRLDDQLRAGPGHLLQAVGQRPALSEDGIDPGTERPGRRYSLVHEHGFFRTNLAVQYETYARRLLHHFLDTTPNETPSSQATRHLLVLGLHPDRTPTGGSGFSDHQPAKVTDF